MKPIKNQNERWIWGLFYYNPSDTRLFPPKKKPFFGWTINFANPKSIAVFALFFVGLLVLVAFLGRQAS